jgi:hypothetical protein
LPLISNPNRLIVEGFDDLQSVAALMSAHVPWPEDKNKAPVWIEISYGIEAILQESFLKTKLRDRDVRTLGVMFDADTKPAGRYSTISSLCEQFFEFPAGLPKEGLVLENSDQKRFGIWIMPDNESEGDMETFLKYLVPNSSEPIWDYAVESVKTAKGMGCQFRHNHLPKANLYTWLAWHDPPGQSPGRALTKKALDPHCPSATRFVDWFRKLYQL